MVCYVIGLKNIQILPSTSILILRVFKNLYSGEGIKKVADFTFRIRQISVDGRGILKEKVADSKVSGYVWLGP